MVYTVGHRKFIVPEGTKCGLPPGTYIDRIGPGWTNVGDITDHDGYNMIGYCWSGLDAHVGFAKEVPIPAEVLYASHYPPGYNVYVDDGPDDDSDFPIHKTKEFK